MKGTTSGPQGARAVLNLEALALLYIALPSALFLLGWIVQPLGSIAALALFACVAWVIVRTSSGDPPSLGRLWPLLIGVATTWCVLGGQGHLLFANSDWWVRDAVLLDLVRDPWPVRYQVDGVELLLRAPVGFYLPAAVCGKLFGIRAAEFFLLAWTLAGVSMVFALLLRDRPGVRTAAIRIGIFVLFSGMDIIPTLVREYPHEVGAMIEWWARFFQYSSTTTLLFWVPNHTMPGWIATAWLLGQDLDRLSLRRAVLFVVLAPIWSPLTALGIAPLVLALIVQRWWKERSWAVVARVLDPRVVIPAVVCLALIYPYLTAGTEKVASGFVADIQWIGDDIVPRYLEFVLVEFVGLAALLVFRQPRDLLLWVAIAVLLALPIYRFGPYNDLAMRSSIPALALLAIRLGRWLSVPAEVVRSPRASLAAIVLLAIGAVTPFMELARPFLHPPWPMNVRSSLVDVTRGTHYLTPSDQPWLEQFLRRPSGP